MFPWLLPMECPMAPGDQRAEKPEAFPFLLAGLLSCQKNGTHSKAALWCVPFSLCHKKIKYKGRNRSHGGAQPQVLSTVGRDKDLEPPPADHSSTDTSSCACARPIMDTAARGEAGQGEGAAVVTNEPQIGRVSGCHRAPCGLFALSA